MNVIVVYIQCIILYECESGIYTMYMNVIVVLYIYIYIYIYIYTHKRQQLYVLCTFSRCVVELYCYRRELCTMYC